MPTQSDGLHDADANLRADRAPVFRRIRMRKQDFPFGSLGFESPGNLDLDFSNSGSDLAGQFYNNLRPLHDNPSDAQINEAPLLVLI